MKPKWKRLATHSKGRIGAVRMRPKCSESVTRLCSTKFASSVWILAGRLAPATKRLLREPELRDLHLRVLHPQAGIASAASTCKVLVIEGIKVSNFSLETFFQCLQSSRKAK